MKCEDFDTLRDAYLDRELDRAAAARLMRTSCFAQPAGSRIGKHARCRKSCAPMHAATVRRRFYRSASAAPSPCTGQRLPSASSCDGRSLIAVEHR